MKRHLLILIIITVSIQLQAQIGINTDTPDTSAVLDISTGAHKGGLLIPRLDKTQRVNIYQPKKSLLIFENTSESFLWNVAGSEWSVLNPWRQKVSATEIEDTITTNDNIKINGSVSANSFYGSGSIPIGGIIMWNGTDIPDGWVLCDGSNGSPDLRGRFIVGKTNDENNIQGGFLNDQANFDDYKNIGSYGGKHEVVLLENQMPTHTHNVLDPGHNHNNGNHRYLMMSDGTATISSNGMDNTNNEPRLNSQLGIKHATTGITIQKAGGDYVPPVTGIDYSGSPDPYHKECYENCIKYSSSADCEKNCKNLNYNENYGKPIIVEEEKWNVIPHENRPPYYVLAFIMRVK